MSSIESAFEEFNETLKKEQVVVEAIRAEVRTIYSLQCGLSRDVERIRTFLSSHAAAASSDSVAASSAAMTAAEDPSAASPFACLPPLLAKAREALDKLSALEPCWTAISAALAEGDATPDRYRDLWRAAIGGILDLVVVLHFMLYGDLVMPDQLAAHAKIPASLGLPLDDYLSAVAGAPPKLVPFSLNAVRAKLFHVPQTISSFCSAVFAGMQLLSLKNGDLRRRFDGLKFAVRDCDQVVYDVVVRGLDKPAGEQQKMEEDGEACK